MQVFGELGEIRIISYGNIEFDSCWVVALGSVRPFVRWIRHLEFQQEIIRFYLNEIALIPVSDVFRRVIWQGKCFECTCIQSNGSFPFWGHQFPIAGKDASEDDAAYCNDRQQNQEYFFQGYCFHMTAVLNKKGRSQRPPFISYTDANFAPCSRS